MSEPFDPESIQQLLDRIATHRTAYAEHLPDLLRYTESLKA
jgi:hypothetical protein